jgi:hypothetical protein
VRGIDAMSGGEVWRTWNAEHAREGGVNCQPLLTHPPRRTSGHLHTSRRSCIAACAYATYWIFIYTPASWGKGLSSHTS